MIYLKQCNVKISEKTFTYVLVIILTVRYKARCSESKYFLSWRVWRLEFSAASLHTGSPSGGGHSTWQCGQVWALVLSDQELVFLKAFKSQSKLAPYISYSN